MSWLYYFEPTKATRDRDFIPQLRDGPARNFNLTHHSDHTLPHESLEMGLNSAIVPLALLSVVLLFGGIAAIILTRKITDIRVLREFERIAQAQQEAEKVEKAKPELVDVYIEQPSKEFVLYREALRWADVRVRFFDPSYDISTQAHACFELVQQPLATTFDESLYCPHPHRAIERRQGRSENPLIDGNVVEVSVGIAMPRPPSHADLDMIYPLESFEYCIGTSDTVVCTLVGARPRLLGLN